MTESTASGSANSETPAGWYSVADGTERFWNGQTWTEDTRPSTPSSGSPAPATNKRSLAKAIGLGLITYLGLLILAVTVAGAIARSRDVSLSLSYPWWTGVVGAGAFLVSFAVGGLYLWNSPRATALAGGLVAVTALIGVGAGFLPETANQKVAYLAGDLRSQLSSAELQQFCSDPNAISTLQQRGAFAADEASVWIEAKEIACTP